jgi:hypothetical protein
MENCLFAIAGCLKSQEKEPTSGFPESAIRTPIHTCGKTSLAASLCAWSPKEWHLKNRAAAISIATGFIDSWYEYTFV